MAEPYFSVVIPVHNEAGNLAPLDAELKSALATLGRSYEIIYVNDGSTDASLAELTTLKDVTIVNLNRCYGQSTAFDAGLRAVRGEVVVMLDGDGQNDPADISRLFQKMQDEKLDVVTGWRKNRQDKQSVRMVSRIGRSLRRILIKDPVHDTGCMLRVITREAANSLELGGEMHRYILALLRWKGFTIGEVVVNDRARVHGRSKYGYGKAIRGFIDLLYVWFLYKYSQRPLHLFGYTSLAAFALGIVSLIATLHDFFGRHIHLNRDGWFFLTFFFFITSIMLFSFGILIDLAMRIYLNTSGSEKRYYIRTVIRT